MDSTPSKSVEQVSKNVEKSILLELIIELSSDLTEDISDKLKGKVRKIIADCHFAKNTSLHKLSTADENTSCLLGVLQQNSADLSYEEQIELNQAIVKRVESFTHALIKELQQYCNKTITRKSRLEQINELQEGLNEKLNMLLDQENEKGELMMEWLNLRSQDMVKLSNNSAELLSLKAKILDLKSKILHLQVLQTIFTETNQSIKSYAEVHKDLKDIIKETEDRIQEYKRIIDSDRI